MLLALLLFYFLIITCTRTINILAGFFLFLMGIGFLLTKINMSIGIIFILIYISAIAIVLVSIVLVLGAKIEGSDINTVMLALIPFFSFLLINQEQLLVAFPQTVSSNGMLTLATDLLVSNAWLTIYLAVYFFAVGLFITGSFFKSLYAKSSAGMRGLSLSSRSSATLLVRPIS